MAKTNPLEEIKKLKGEILSWIRIEEDGITGLPLRLSGVVDRLLEGERNRELGHYTVRPTRAALRREFGLSMPYTDMPMTKRFRFWLHGVVSSLFIILAMMLTGPTLLSKFIALVSLSVSVYFSVYVLTFPFKSRRYVNSKLAEHSEGLIKARARVERYCARLDRESGFLVRETYVHVKHWVGHFYRNFRLLSVAVSDQLIPLSEEGKSFSEKLRVRTEAIRSAPVVFGCEYSALMDDIFQKANKDFGNIFRSFSEKIKNIESQSRLIESFFFHLTCFIEISFKNRMKEVNDKGNSADSLEFRNELMAKMGRDISFVVRVIRIICDKLTILISSAEETANLERFLCDKPCTDSLIMRLISPRE